MNKHTKHVSDAALRCLAFGHAWEMPADWARFNNDPEVSWVVDSKGRESATLKLTRTCVHGCGTIRNTVITLRLSGRGNLVEVVSTRSNRVYTDPTYDAARQSATEAGEPPPGRKDYRAELLARQARSSLQSAGVRARRAAADITAMGVGS